MIVQPSTVAISASCAHFRPGWDDHANLPNMQAFFDLIRLLLLLLLLLLLSWTEAADSPL